jgi:hypothetical protein
MDSSARDRGLRRVGLITATLAAGGIVGTAAVAVAAHAATTSATTNSTTNSDTTSGDSSGTSSDSNGSSGYVSPGAGVQPHAQSSGS